MPFYIHTLCGSNGGREKTEPEVYPSGCARARLAP